MVRIVFIAGLLTAIAMFVAHSNTLGYVLFGEEISLGAEVIFDMTLITVITVLGIWLAHRKRKAK